MTGRSRYAALAYVTGLAAGIALLSCGEAARPSANDGRASLAGSVARGGRRVHPGPAPYLHGDRDDDDIGGGPADRDDRRVRMYGHESSVGERASAAEAVRSYFAAAAARDGRGACSLVSSRLAKASSFTEFLPEEYRPARGSSVFAGKKCPEVAEALFEIDHQRLAEVGPSVQVISLRVKNDGGLAFLGFATAGEGVIAMSREGGVWRVDELLDDKLP